MNKSLKLSVFVFVILFMFSCNDEKKESKEEPAKEELVVNAKEILGNPDYLAISYGGYRQKDRNIQPTILELKEDMKILSAMGVKVLRTYNVHFDQAANLLKAIDELKVEDPEFEMYVMLGIWIDCKSAFNWENGEPDHNQESERNPVEVKTAVELAKQYPDIVKILAVGNEAMVKWATSYYVEPWIILKWVKHLQDLKQKGDLPKDLWITSSDDYSSWGGGDSIYHTEDLEKLAHAVDYVSMHTYAYHNSHYNPEFWKVPESEESLTDKEKIDAAMLRALDFAKMQYDSVSNYMKSIGVNKPIHIGETGWASISGGHYGKNGSRATDEYKQGLYYKHIRNWTKQENISVFYFEAFDEQWKDAEHELGSENHFGLINLKSEAKYPLWNLVDDGTFNGLKRDGKPITKTYNGNLEALMKEVLVPNTDYPRD
ncbi:glycosyl hydrolase family 17 [Winogradskyella litoriviva]|uniref:Endo-1,3-beta-glucanase btgC n=1 Tax=Winogradskyella litoriviva TaxID=1220182 RepID=A0ABX2E5R7_9FLAO|nr:glycosyl hydrolase family 17 protein [Winogradskyella litoriviva]NRD23331.1 glycosyl hydrolase family 17 [Winogradskyella litoriviva]